MNQLMMRAGVNMRYSTGFHLPQNIDLTFHHYLHTLEYSLDSFHNSNPKKTSFLHKYIFT